MTAPDHGHRFSVTSPSGVHIGLWDDGLIAAKVASERQGNTVEELVTLAHSDALVAATYEAAAQSISPDARLPDAEVSAKKMRSALAIEIRDAIPADAQAALDAIKAEVRRETLKEAAARYTDAYAAYGADRTDAYAKGYCGGVEAMRAAILALMEQDT